MGSGTDLARAAARERPWWGIHCNESSRGAVGRCRGGMHPLCVHGADLLKRALSSRRRRLKNISRSAIPAGSGHFAGSNLQCAKCGKVSPSLATFKRTSEKNLSYGISRPSAYGAHPIPWYCRVPVYQYNLLSGTTWEHCIAGAIPGMFSLIFENMGAN